MTSLRTSDFDYVLPPELVAQTPIEPRDHSRLLVLHRAEQRWEHRHFYDLPEYLRRGDLMVFNDSRVIPARLFGKKGSGGKVEFLLLHRQADGLWEVLARPGRRLQPGHVVELQGTTSPGERAFAEIVAKGEGGTRIVRFSDESVIERLGQVPLPPYIHEPLRDPERYQTVYSRVKGSSAAPTAGLHFTPHLLQRIAEMGVEFAFVTLHVGMDSFRTVKVEDPRQHQLHKEYGEVSAEAAEAVNAARQQGRRVVCVGTTAARILEHVALRQAQDDPSTSLRVSGNISARGELRPKVESLDKVGPVEPRAAQAQDTALHNHGRLVPFCGWVDLMILPGHTFRAIDALATNFHLPRSTLLMLVCAFAGREMVLQAYEEAIRQKYRFYSFGDAMVVV